MHPVRSLRAVLCKASRRLSWTDPWMGALLSRREFDGDFPLQIGTHNNNINNNNNNNYYNNKKQKKDNNNYDDDDDAFIIVSIQGTSKLLIGDSSRKFNDSI